MKPTKPPSHNAPAGGHGHSPAGSRSSGSSRDDEMHNDDTAHEHTDINIPALVWSMVVMFGTVIGTAVLMYLLFFYVLEPQAAARDPKLSPLAMPATTMPPTTIASPFFGSAPEPKLMTVEPLHLKDVRAAEQQALHGYGWVDEKAGVARIPIDEAKKLTLERGLAVRPDPLTDERLGTRRPASGESSSGRNVTRTLAASPATPAPAAAPAKTGHDTHK
jgi:hypothetical protein